MQSPNERPIITVRVSHEQMAALGKIAHESGNGYAWYVRKALAREMGTDQDAEVRTFAAVEDQKEKLRKLVYLFHSKANWRRTSVGISRENAELMRGEIIKLLDLFLALPENKGIQEEIKAAKRDLEQVENHVRKTGLARPGSSESEGRTGAKPPGVDGRKGDPARA